MNLFEALTHIASNGTINAVTRDGDGTIEIDLLRLDDEHETIVIANDLRTGDSALVRALAEMAQAYLNGSLSCDGERRQRVEGTIARGLDLAARIDESW